MNIIIVLTFLLFFLMEEIGGKKGVKSFASMLFTLIILTIAIMLMANGYNSLLVSIVAGIIISGFSLFFISGYNQKTVSAFISVLITLFLMLCLITFLGGVSKIQGFGEEEYDEISAFSLYVKVNYSGLLVSAMILGLLGAVIDVAVSVVSAINELYKNNPLLTPRALFDLGMKVGRDILGTMTNTIYFAFLGGYLALLIWFKDLSYSIGAIINSKVFCAEIIQVLCSSMGAALVIPVTAGVSTVLIYARTGNKQKTKQ